MKLKENFKLRDIDGETIIVNQGKLNVDLTRIVSLNPSARLLWEQLSGKDFTTGDAATILIERYGIPEAQALADAAVWVSDLQQWGMVTELVTDEK